MYFQASVYENEILLDCVYLHFTHILEFGVKLMSV